MLSRLNTESDTLPLGAPRARFSAPEWLGVLRSSWLWAVPVMLIAWQPLPLVPSFGVDSSWMVGLTVAAGAQLAHGTDVVYTLGPYGFLTVPSVAGNTTAVLGAVYALVSRYALAITLIWAVRRSFGLALAVPIASIGSLITPEAMITVAFIWAAVAISEDPPAFAPRLLVYGGGFAAALELLTKADVGVLVALLCAIGVLGLPTRRRDAPRFAAVLVGSFVALWVAAAMPLGNLPEFFRGVWEISAGYSGALVLEHPRVAWDEYAALALIAVTIGLCAWRARPLPRAQGAALIGLALALCFIQFKHGFVRHEPGHTIEFFAAMLAPWFAFRWEREQRFVAAAALVTITVVWFLISAFPVWPTVQPYDRADAAYTDVRTLVDPSRRHGYARYTRFSLRSTYGLDRRTLHDLRNHTVAVEPWEINIAWAYGLDWTPLPVMQPLSAYTPYLDQLNARRLSGPDAPQRILRHRTAMEVNNPGSGLFPSYISLDGRYAPWDAPAETRALLCNYRPIRTTARYQVLARAGRDRCGPAHAIGSTSVRYGEPLQIPPATPGEVVFARVSGLEPTGIERLRQLLYRAPHRYADLGFARFVLIPANAGEGLIVRAPADLDFPKPFGLAPDRPRITFSKDQAPFSSENELQVEFFAVPMRPW